MGSWLKRCLEMEISILEVSEMNIGCKPYQKYKREAGQCHPWNFSGWAIMAINSDMQAWVLKFILGVPIRYSRIPVWPDWCMQFKS